MRNDQLRTRTRLSDWRATGRNNQLRKAVPLIRLVFKQAASQFEAEAQAEALQVFTGMDERTKWEVISLVQSGIPLVEAVTDDYRLML